MTDKRTHILAKAFNARGFNFEQIKRKGNIALYRKAKEGEGGLVESFEVIKIRTRKAAKLPSGKSLPQREIYPASSDWGTYGWTSLTSEDALRGFHHLVRDEQAKESKAITA